MFCCRGGPSGAAPAATSVSRELRGEGQHVVSTCLTLYILRQINFLIPVGDSASRTKKKALTRFIISLKGNLYNS